MLPLRLGSSGSEQSWSGSLSPTGREGASLAMLPQ